MRYLAIILMFVVLSSKGQAIRDINFNYLYDPGQAFTLNLKQIRQPQQWLIRYEVLFQDTLLKPGEISIEWQLRESLVKEEFFKLDSTYRITSEPRRRGIVGTVSLPLPLTSKILVARVNDLTFKKTQ